MEAVVIANGCLQSRRQVSWRHALGEVPVLVDREILELLLFPSGHILGIDCMVYTVHLVFQERKNREREREGGRVREAEGEGEGGGGECVRGSLGPRDAICASA